MISFDEIRDVTHGQVNELSMHLFYVSYMPTIHMIVSYIPNM